MATDLTPDSKPRIEPVTRETGGAVVIDVRRQSSPRDKGQIVPAAAPGGAKCPAPRDLAPSRVRWPGQVFAPMVDIGLSAATGRFPQYDLVSAADDFGVKFFTLGFVTGDSAGRPIFAGYRMGSPWDQGLREQIVALRELGGDVAISFGGANGADAELARTIVDVDELAETYKSLVAAYGVQRIDFDIEESAADDAESIDRRSQAIGQLQESRAAEGNPLEVWFSVAALPTGISEGGISVVKSALGAGVDIAGINVMAMNFGAVNAPSPAERMGDYAIQAARHSFVQLRRLFARPGRSGGNARLWSTIGVTPMIGQNDIRSERFSLADARKLLAFAEENGLGLISLWSMNRDANTGEANYDSTAIAQAPYDFTRLFAGFTKDPATD